MLYGVSFGYGCCVSGATTFPGDLRFQGISNDLGALPESILGVLAVDAFVIELLIG
jgi:hypothetical protein